MKLIVGWGIEFGNPFSQDIEQTLLNMPDGEHSFVILAREATNFIQAAVGNGDVVVVEYQEGATRTAL
jgi:hypothetical protein